MMTTVTPAHVRALYDSSALPNLVTMHSAQADKDNFADWRQNLSSTTYKSASFAGYIADRTSLVTVSSPGFYSEASLTAGTKAAKFSLASFGAQRLWSPPAAVIPGQFLSWSINVGDTDASKGWTYLAQIVFADANDAFLSNGGAEQSVARAGSGTSLVPIGQGGITVPAGAASARIRVRIQSAGADLAAQAAGTYAYLGRVMIVTSSTSGPVAARVPFAEPVWTEITGSAVSFRIVRGGDLEGVVDALETGTVTMTAKGATLDPATNLTLRRGRRFRVETVAATERDWTNPERLFTGQIENVDADYAEDKGLAAPRVIVTAVDPVAVLKSTPFARTFAGDLTQKIKSHLLLLPQIPSQVDDGATFDPGSTGLLYGSGYDTGANVWSQMMRARNSFANGKVFVTRAGAVSAGVFTGARARAFVFSGAADAAQSFTDLDLSLGTQTVINSLVINELGGGDGGADKTFGPYQNLASIAQWGPVSATVDTSDGSPSALAAAYLKRLSAATASPRRINYRPSLDAGRLVDLYDTARVILPSASLDATLYVIGVEHTITPEGWLTVLRLRPLDDQAANVVSNPAAGADTGPADEASVRGPLGSRYRSSTFSVPNAAWTTVPHETSSAQDQITYDGAGGQKVGRAGRYLITAGLELVASNATGYRGLRIALNGTTFLATTTVAGSTVAGTGGLVLAKVARLAANDVVTTQAYQSSGAALNAAGGAAVRSTFLDVTYLGD